MTEVNYVNLVIEKGIQKAMAHIKAGRAFIGKSPGGQLVSPEKQLEAYMELTPEDMRALQATQGPEKFTEFIIDIEKARQRREKNGNGKNTR